MNCKIEYAKIGCFFNNFIKSCKQYQEYEHVFEFGDVTLTDEFLLLSGLADKEYSVVSFKLDEPKVFVFDKNDAGKNVVFSSIIECSLSI